MCGAPIHVCEICKFGERVSHKYLLRQSGADAVDGFRSANLVLVDEHGGDITLGIQLNATGDMSTFFMGSDEPAGENNCAHPAVLLGYVLVINGNPANQDPTIRQIVAISEVQEFSVGHRERGQVGGVDEDKVLVEFLQNLPVSQVIFLSLHDLISVQSIDIFNNLFKWDRQHSGSLDKIRRAAVDGL